MQRREGVALGGRVVEVERVVGKTESLELGDGEHARRRLPELRRDLAADRDARDVGRPVVPGIREVASEPADAGIRAARPRIRRPPDAARLVVRHAVVGIAAALDDRDLAEVVELLQPGERGMERELRPAAGVGPDGGRGERGLREVDPAAARPPVAVVGGAQRTVRVRHDGVEPVVAAVEIDDDEVAVADRRRERLAHERGVPQARPEQRAGRDQAALLEKSSSRDGHAPSTPPSGAGTPRTRARARRVRSA